VIDDLGLLIDDCTVLYTYGVKSASVYQSREAAGFTDHI
jgi:hypothetical protein